MKAMRLILCLTILSVSLAIDLTIEAAENKSEESPKAVENCAAKAEQMRHAIQANPDQLPLIFQKAISNSTHCACELLTEAIRLSDGGAAMVKQLVVIALRQAEEQASAIAECAVLAAPDQVEVIREAFDEVKPRQLPLQKKPEPDKQASGDRGKVGAMIKKLVPGWKNKKESKAGPESNSQAKPGSEIESQILSKPDANSQMPRRGVMQTHLPESASGKDIVAEDQPESWKLSGAIGMRAAFHGYFLEPYALFNRGSLQLEELKELEELEGGAKREKEGFHYFAYLDNGYDSNVNTAIAGERVSSYFLGGGIGTYYALVTDKTRVRVKARFGVRYEENVPVGMDDVLYRGRLLSEVEHKVSDRIRVSNRTGIRYDGEPDFLSGETVGYRADQYFFAYNRLALGIRWASQFETRTYYTLSTIQYEDAWLGAQEDRWRHLWGQQLRYSWSEQRVAYLEYRYGKTDFHHVGKDNQSHYFLGGLEYDVSPSIRGAVVAGAEKRDFAGLPEAWRPYAEASFQARLSDQASLRWGGRLGFEDAEIGPHQDRYSFRTAVRIDHQLRDDLGASLGFFYLRSDMESSGEGGNGYYEDAVMLQLALRYTWFDNLDAYLAYDFTHYNSADPLRNYDRHRVTVGVNSLF